MVEAAEFESARIMLACKASAVDHWAMPPCSKNLVYPVIPETLYNFEVQLLVYTP